MSERNTAFTQAYVGLYEQLSSDTGAYEATAKALAELLKSRIHNQSIVAGEIGSGTGNSSIAFLKFLPIKSLWAIEPSDFIRSAQGKFYNIPEQLSPFSPPEYMAKMRKRAEKYKEKVHLVRAVGENIPLRPESMDAVLCCESFHWLRAEKALPEIYRILKPGGYLLLDESGYQIDMGEPINNIHVTKHPLFKTFQMHLNQLLVQRGLIPKATSPEAGYLFTVKGLRELVRKYGFKAFPVKDTKPDRFTKVPYSFEQVKSVTYNAARMVIAGMQTAGKLLKDATPEDLEEVVTEAVRMTELEDKDAIWTKNKYAETFAAFIFQKQEEATAF